MNRKTYLIVLYIATAICCILGAAYHLSGYLWNHSSNNPSMWFSGNATTDPSYGDTKTGTHRLDSFQNLRIDASNMEITVETGTEYRVTYYCDSLPIPEVRHIGNDLTIQQPEFSSILPNDIRCEVKVTVPEDAELHTLDIQADVGNITLSGLSAEHAYLEADVGTVTADSCSFTLIDASADVGSLAFKSCILNQGEISSDVGAVSLNDCSFDNLELSGELGDIFISTSVYLADYRLDLNADMGRIKVYGKGFKERYYQSGSAGKSLIIENDMGDIEIVTVK